LKKYTKLIVVLVVICSLLALDLTTKYIFDAQLSDGNSISVVPYLFNFKLVHNYGAAWGILAGRQLFLIALTIVFLGVFIAYYVKEKNKSWLFVVSFAFLIAGCLGNLYDRIIFGYVRDFIQFDFWKSFPIFNFADAILVVGVVLFIIYLIISLIKAKKVKKNEE